MFGQYASAYESPDYEIAAEHEEFEVRTYAPYLIAETAVPDGAFEAGRRAAFRRLFDYIGGANIVGQKIDMTVPVTQQPAAGERIAMTVPVTTAQDEAGQVMRFALPSRFNLANAPIPSDPRVALRELPGERLAVRRYSGRSNEANFVRERDALFSDLERLGIAVIGPARFAVYSGPFTPWFARRNEVQVPVDIHR